VRVRKYNCGTFHTAAGGKLWKEIEGNFAQYSGEAGYCIVKRAEVAEDRA